MVSFPDGILSVPCRPTLASFHGVGGFHISASIGTSDNCFLYLWCFVFYFCGILFSIFAVSYFRNLRKISPTEYMYAPRVYVPESKIILLILDCSLHIVLETWINRAGHKEVCQRLKILHE